MPRTVKNSSDQSQQGEMSRRNLAPSLVAQSSFLRLQVMRHTVPLPNLSSALQGITIALLTDLHFNPLRWNQGVVEKAIARSNAYNPDFVFLGGDFLDGGPSAIEDALVTLAKLRAKRGIYAVLGNHDYIYFSFRNSSFIRQLEQLGIVVLRNQIRRITINGADLIIIGIDDPVTKHDNLSQALSYIPAGKAPRILLSHAPSIVEQMIKGDADVVLSGHTHGGGPRVPFLSALLPALQHTTYRAGWYDLPQTRLYVSVGLGMVGLPVRFNTPELSFFEFNSPGRV